MLVLGLSKETATLPIRAPEERCLNALATFEASKTFRGCTGMEQTGVAYEDDVASRSQRRR